MFEKAFHRRKTYCDTCGIIARIESVSSKSGYFLSYDEDDAEYDLRCSRRLPNEHRPSAWEIQDQLYDYADKQNGFVCHEMGRDFVKTYQTWYEYEALITYIEKNDETEIEHTSPLKLSTQKELHCGDTINVRYNIDNPSKIEEVPSEIDNMFISVGIVLILALVVGIVIASIILLINK